MNGKHHKCLLIKDDASTNRHLYTRNVVIAIACVSRHSRLIAIADDAFPIERQLPFDN